MRFASLEIVKVLKPRLGFGSPEACEEPEPSEVPLTFQADPLPVPVEPPADPAARPDEPQMSLLRLAEQLESALKTAPPETRLKASEDLKELARLFGPPVPHEPEANGEPLKAPGGQAPPVDAPKSVKGLEGCRVAALGFGRQDIAGLAAGMLEQSARIEFLPRGDNSRLREFDLILLNAASIEILKREIASFREVLSMGIPAIVVGSRAALNLLRDSNSRRSWDFAAKPLHMEELVWRAVSLLSRQEESGVSQRLPSRVVVADNDPFTRALVESAMAQLGVECELTEEGEAAWNAIEKSRPGVVILDLTLPNRDGFQLMADIRRAAGRKPKVIVLSARQSEADILRAFALGADDYVTKPFSPLELSARLTRLLGGDSDNA